MKKEVFAILILLAFSSIACATPPTLIGEKNHVESANIGEKVLISYDFNKIGEAVSSPSQRQAIDVILIIDTSGSMATQINGVKKIDSAKSAAEEFVDGLNPLIDRVGVGIINNMNENKILIEPTGDFDSVKSKISSFKASGGTYGSEVVFQSVNFLKYYGRDDATKAIFLFTDGVFTNENQKELINNHIKDSTEKGIKTYTSFFGTYSIASEYLKALAKTGNGEYFDSPTGEELKENFMKVLKILKENVASDFVLNDSFLPGVQILEEDFPRECQKSIVNGNYAISCKRDSLFSLSSNPFSFSFFVNVTSPGINKLSTNAFVSYKNYSGEESILVLLDKTFKVISGDDSNSEKTNCSKLEGGFCSTSLIENSEIKENHFCDAPEEKCYACKTEFSFDSKNNKCIKIKEDEEDTEEEETDIEEWACVNGFGYSYWNSSKDKKEWIYSSNPENNEKISKCNKYNKESCCPDNFVCGSDGKCFLKYGFFEYCSSLTTKQSCENDPDNYAKNELKTIMGEKFLPTTCSEEEYSDAIGCTLKSSCMCVWDSSSKKCSPNEKIAKSCRTTDVSGNPTISESTGTCTYEKTEMEDHCDSPKGGFYLITYLAKRSENYPNPESCKDVSQQVNCVSNLTIPFFGIFNIAFVMIAVGFAYLLLKKNHKI